MKVTVEVVQSVNKALKNGGSLNQLDKTEVFCNLSRKAFKANAEKLGYSYDRKKNEFIITSNNTEEHKKECDSKTLDNTKECDKITSNNTKTKKAAKSDSETSDNTVKCDKETFNNIIERLNKLENIVFNNKFTSDFILDERLNETNIITRSFRVDKDALDAFNSVCENELAKYEKQKLISQALLEFVAKYGVNDADK